MKTFSLAFAIALMPLSAFANDNDCKDLPSHGALKVALDGAVAAETSGLNFHMWATIVNRDGVVCAMTRRTPGFENARDRSACTSSAANPRARDSGTME